MGALFRAVKEILWIEVDAVKRHLGEPTFKKLDVQFTTRNVEIDRLLRNAAVRTWVFEKIGFPCGVDYPEFDATLLDGHASDAIHRSNYRTILVSNQAEDETKTFWRCLATWQKRKFKEYDEVFAAAGSDIVNGRREQTEP